MWVVYERPTDYPEDYVARLWRVGAGLVGATLEKRVHETLDGVRAQLPPGLCRLPRQEDDEPHVVETWF